jgi:IclR family acetate operon transcriptional repressor
VDTGRFEVASRQHHVQSVTRAIELLKAVAAAGSASVSTLAEHCELNRATAWRLLTTLEAQGMVTRDSHSGWFSVGPAVSELVVRPRSTLAEAAQPLLERLSLETGEIACLGIPKGDRVEYVAEVIPTIVQEDSWLGQPVVLHASSMGKAFLAQLDDRQVVRLIGSTPHRFTDTTITDLDALFEELQRVRAQGYAVCAGELEEGSWGVAAPVLDRHGATVAVVCLWGPDQRGDRDRLAALGRLARRAARELGSARR